MLEPPDLADAAIIAALGAGYGLRAPTIAFLQVGNDAASWAFRVEAANGTAYFLKVRAGARSAPGAAVPAYLHRHGVPNVLAPIATATGAPDVALDRFTLALYPMLDATPAVEVGMPPTRWRELGSTLRRVHAIPVTPELARMVGEEPFRPSGRDRIAEIDTLLVDGPDDPVAAGLAGFWLARRGVVHALAERTDELGGRLAGAGFPPVLCHADLHTWNVLIGADERLWVVDWDEAILAPRERDLMFVVGGIGRDLVGPRDTESFLRGYGETPIDQDLLAYYRAAWAVQDLAAYGEQVLMAPRLGDRSRRAALEGLVSLFEPGNIVDIATASPAPHDGLPERRTSR